MKSTFISAAMLSSLLGMGVQAIPQGRIMTCSETADCPPETCNNEGFNFICEYNECKCKAPDAPPPEQLFACANHDECNGKMLCPDANTLPFCDNGFCRDCRAPVEEVKVVYHKLGLAENLVSWGTSVNEDEGKGMMKTIADKLLESCPEDATSCSGDPIDLGRISLILNEGREYMNLQATIDRSNYATKESRDFMIAAISLGTVSAARSSCQVVGYWELVQGGIGCPDGDHTGLSYKRDALASVPFKDPSPEEEGDSRLEARIGDGAVDKPERSCRYRTNMCAGPKSLYSINGFEGDPYQDDMLLRFDLVAPPDALGETATWWCENGLGLLADLAIGKLPGYAADILGLGGIPSDPIEIICGKYTGPDPEDFEVE